MVRRQLLLSSLLFLALLPTTVVADETVVSSEELSSPSNLAANLRLSLSYPYVVATSRSDQFLAGTTMWTPSPGSLVIRYEGFHGFVVRHIRSQSRRFVRHALRKGWYIPPDEMSSARGIYERIDDGYVDFETTGVWWNRPWWESLPPEKGGAPADPYVHVYGQETSRDIGPFTITNEFKIKFDYVAFLEVNPDPVSHEHSARRNTPISLDVESARGASVGTDVRFRLKPQIRLGLPDSDGLQGLLRSLSLRGVFEFRYRKKEFAVGEIEIAWGPTEGASVNLELTLVSW